MTAGQIAGVLGQDPGHELMALFAHSLRDLGRRLLDEHSGSFGALVDSTNGSAVSCCRAPQRVGSASAMSRTTTGSSCRS